ncbi:MAG: hypothetical protein AAF410_03425 [Pseudomonadota bacterium]
MTLLTSQGGQVIHNYIFTSNMKNFILFLLLLILPMITKAENFIYDIQLAGYQFNQYDDKGNADLKIFMEEFRTFPWSEQVGKANGGSEPTISVRNLSEKTVYWVSAAPHEEGHVYLLGIVYPKVKKSFFGLGKDKKIRWVEIYVDEDGSAVEDIASAFFDGNFESLMSQLSTLPKFAEMESQR